MHYYCNEKFQDHSKVPLLSSGNIPFWSIIFLILVTLLWVAGCVCAPILFRWHTVFCTCNALLWNSFLKQNHLPHGGVAWLNRSSASFIIFISWKGLFDAFNSFWKLLYTLWYWYTTEVILAMPVPWLTRSEFLNGFTTVVSFVT